MPSKTRYDFIDYAKMVAITIMVIWHTSPINSIMGSFSVATFIFIGGLFAKGKNSTFIEVLSKGFKQLIVPYFIFSIFSFVFCWISPYLHPELYYGVDNFKTIFKRAFIGMLLMQDRVTPYSFMPCGPLWFLPALFWCRIFFYCWIKSYNRVFKWVLRFLLFTLLFLLYWYKISIFSISSAAVSFPVYLCGYYIRNFILHSLPQIRVSSILLLCSIIFAILYVFDGHQVEFDGATYKGDRLLSYIRCIACPILIIALVSIVDRMPIPHIKRFISQAGTATIAILALHGIGIIAFKVFYTTLGFNPQEIPFIFAIPLSIIIVLACTWVYHKVLVKYFPISVGKGSLPDKKTSSTIKKNSN